MEKEKHQELQQLTAYLCGPMEYAGDYGIQWRLDLRKRLAPLGIKCILPNEEEANIISGQDELNRIKETDQEEYLLIMRLFIEADLLFVLQSDMIITCWEGERMSGTIGEAQHAYLNGIPAYLITSKKFSEIPGWFAACYTQIFPSIDKFVEFIGGANG